MGATVRPESVATWPDRIHVYVHSGDAGEILPEKWGDGLDVRRFQLKEGGKTYCRIALGVKGRNIEKARVEVFYSKTEVPKYSDYRSIDCVGRGIFASFGFVGALRFPLRDFYSTEYLREPALSQGKYVASMIDGFMAFQSSLGE